MWALMLSMRWWAECKQRSTFPLRALGTTILPYINTRSLSVLSWCCTSQKSWISGSVRECLVGNLGLIVFIKVVSLWSFWPNTQMWSGDMAVTSLLELVIACMVTNSIAASIFSDRWICLKEGCVGHRLRRASIVAIGLQDIASTPLCYLAGQC